MKRFVLFAAVAMFMCNVALAQTPQIKIINSDETEQENVALQSMKIDVEIFGNIATTTMTMVFSNSSNRILEGELTFPMPEGVTVSRYAIDINGRLRDAVPVAKAKATEVFESIEHRNVDPGLLEKVEGNNFRTRIYPLPAGGNRTVVVAYEEALNFASGAMRYHLPMAYANKIHDFWLTAKVYQSQTRPQLEEQPDGSFSFAQKSNVYEASMHKTDYAPQKSLTVNLPKNIDAPEVVMQQNTNGSYYFLINAYPKSSATTKTWSSKLGVIWDVSLSGLHRDTKKELDLLDRIIRAKQNLTVELGLLNINFEKAKTFKISNGDWSKLRAYIENLTYDGGTDFSVLNAKTLKADEYLFFTDGLSTFGENLINIGKPMYCINSSPRADYSTMKFASAKNGGKFINLANTTIDEAENWLNKNNLQFLGIKESNIVSQTYPSIPTETNGYISVAGISARAGETVTLFFGHNGKVEFEQKVKLVANATEIDVSKVWAQKKITELDINYAANKDDIETLGRQFGIVTRGTSLLVLESVSDYVRYHITPPAELLHEYNQLIEDKASRREERVNDLLEDAVDCAEDLEEWWNTDFKPEKKHPAPVKTNNNVQIENNVQNGNNTQNRNIPEHIISESTNLSEIFPEQTLQRISGIVVEERYQNEPIIGASVRIKGTRIGTITDIDGKFTIQMPLGQRLIISYIGFKNQEVVVQNTDPMHIILEEDNLTLDEVVTIGYGRDMSINVSAAPKIKVPKIESNKDYVQIIKKAANPYKEYIALRPKYLGTPSYFLDVANYFYAKNDNKTALLVLSSIADLDLGNAELFKIIAYKLKEKGEFARELYITQKIKDWRPMDPQSHRDYALALQDNDRYNDALQTLYSVLTASYSPEAANRDYGIEEIIVSEINNLVSLHKKDLKLDSIEPKIIVDLPVDVRVVINWNKNDTDIDLWVTDPNGEKCMYDHKRTQIGGRISDDFTGGLGPEQFMLKKAIKGKYIIETDFYDERQLSISGPTTIMAEIYLRYSSGRQKRKIIVFQSSEKGEDEEEEEDSVLIGEFEF